METMVRLATYNYVFRSTCNVPLTRFHKANDLLSSEMICFVNKTVASFLIAFEDPSRVLQQHWDVLLKCLQSNPTGFAASLYSKSLISPDTLERVIVTGVLEQKEKAAILLLEVGRVIGASSSMDRRKLFQEFCCVVKDDPVAGRLMESALAD